MASGTYTWSDTQTEFTLNFSEIGINYNFDLGIGTPIMPVDGTVIVSVTEGTYTVEFTLILKDDKTVTGIYSGLVTLF
ncbi:MAG: hypothetical protein V3W20_03175 [Candidatus Neomarinimicrobiota bacterium]